MTTVDRAARPALDAVTAAAAALGTALVLETLRLWFPAVAFIFGRAGSTDPLVLGVFAIVTFALAFAAAPLVRWRGSRQVMMVAAGSLVIARVVTQAASGGDLQLWSTTVGTVAGLVFLAACAGGGVARSPLAVGLAGGLAIDAALEALLGGSSIDWVGGIIAWALLLPLLVVFGLLLQRSQPAQMVLGTRAWPWLLLGPVLALHLILGGAQPALVAATTGAVVGGPSARFAAAAIAGLVIAAYALGTRYGWEVRARSRRGWLLPLVILVGVIATLGLVGRPALLVTELILIVALGASAAVLSTVDGRSTPARHALAAAGGTFLLFLVAFPYYAAYDLPLGVPNVAFVLGAAVVLAVGTLFAGRRGSNVEVTAPPTPSRTAAAIGAVAVLMTAAVAVHVSVPSASGGEGFPVRVVLANLHMGFDTVGRYVAPDQAQAIAAQGPDVVVLNEVDRGWALNGGQDVLVDLARGLGLPYVFAPAADDIWGNAILSRYPVLETGQEILPDSGGYMIRSAVWVVVDLGGGRELGVVGTHLHHRGDDASIREPQARRVADIATELSLDGRSVVIAGDLNATPGSPELASLEDRFVYATPGTPPFTYPAWDPDETIDHIFMTPDLRPSGFEVPRSELSDHLWIAVTVEPVTS